MQSLGDFFPDELIEQNAENNLKIGAVIRRFETSTIPPKIKRSIIIGFDTDSVVLAYIFINTEINPHLFSSQELKDLHLELETTDRPYLSHTSFADCSQLHEDSVESIKALIASDSSSHLGELSLDDLSLVLQKIKSAKTISNSKKRKFGLL